MIAGSEGTGFRVDGEVCGEETLWRDNYAHSCLAGVVMFPDEKDGTATCTLVNGFIVYKNWYYGMYLQLPYSLHVTNSMMFENRVGSNILIYSPDSKKHQYEDKEVEIRDCVYMGKMPGSNCTDMLDKDTER